MSDIMYAQWMVMIEFLVLFLLGISSRELHIGCCDGLNMIEQPSMVGGKYGIITHFKPRINKPWPVGQTWLAPVFVKFYWNTDICFFLQSMVAFALKPQSWVVAKNFMAPSLPEVFNTRFIAFYSPLLYWESKFAGWYQLRYKTLKVHTAVNNNNKKAF